MIDKTFENVTEQNPVLKSYFNTMDFVQKMEDGSAYQRELLPDGRKHIFSPERGEFFIKRIKENNSAEVEKIKKFLEEFDPKESDPEEIGRNITHNQYGYYLVENAEGEQIVYGQRSLIKFLPRDQIQGEPEKAMVFVGHTTTRGDFRRKGLAKELVITLLEDSAEQSKSQNWNLEVFIGECTRSSERFWNAVGWKRLYLEDKDGNYHEVPYIQPPIFWVDKEKGIPGNPETGKEGGVDELSAKEHLMLMLTDGRQELQINELMPMIRKIYEDNYEGKDFEGDREWPAIMKVLQGILDKFENALNQAEENKIILLSAGEREAKIKELKKEGKEFFEI